MLKGRLPRPLAVVSAFALCSQRGLATTKRTSSRTKRSPCWHSPSSLLAASGRLGGAASGRYHVVIFTKRNPTKCSGRGYVSVGLRSCVAAPNLRLLNTRFTGRLPRPLPVLPALVQSHQRGLATTNRTSPRGMKRSPCWHSPSFLLAASGRLGGASSGCYHVVIFTKRNPTKCSRRFMSVLGCAPASLHPTYNYSMPDSQTDCRAILPNSLQLLLSNGWLNGAQRRLNFSVGSLGIYQA